MTDATPTEDLPTASPDDRLVPEFSLSGEHQVLVLGVLVAVIMLFGGQILDFFSFLF